MMRGLSEAWLFFFFKQFFVVKDAILVRDTISLIFSYTTKEKNLELAILF